MASYSVSVRRVRDFVIGFLRIPPRDGHPCLDGWFRSSRSMGDFHPLNASHTEHTRPKAYATESAEKEHRGLRQQVGKHRDAGRSGKEVPSRNREPAFPAEGFEVVDRKEVNVG